MEQAVFFRDTGIALSLRSGLFCWAHTVLCASSQAEVEFRELVYWPPAPALSLETI